jgi:hypothetical protein
MEPAGVGAQVVLRHYLLGVAGEEDPGRGWPCHGVISRVDSSRPMPRMAAAANGWLVGPGTA